MDEDGVEILEPKKDPELDLNFHTDMPVGEILRRTRVYYDQTLQQVEGFLRIRASHLDALEKGDISQLPGKVYAIGFVRSYSEYLGLDGDKMVHLFKEQHGGKQKKPDLSFPVPASESRTPGMFIIGACIFGIAVLSGFIAYFVLPPKEKNVVPQVPERMSQARLNEAPALVGSPPPPENPKAAEKEPDVTPAPGTASKDVLASKPVARLVLEVTDPSWVEIRNAQGAAILRQVLKPGDKYMVPDEPGLVMATGNAGGISLTLDGRKLPPLGTIGEIKRSVVLSPGALVGAKASRPDKPEKIDKPALKEISPQAGVTIPQSPPQAQPQPEAEPEPEPETSEIPE
jgi:cytoskeleton protein RodZ